MNGIQIVAEARVGNDPELREVNGTAVCNISLGVTERKQNKQTQQWEDGQTTWLRAAVWGAMASNVAASVTKGQLVNVTGTLSERKYTTNENQERTQLEVRVDSISPSLRFATAQVIPNDRGSRGGAPQQQPQQQYNPAAQGQMPWQGQGPGQAPQQPAQQWPPAQQPAPQQMPVNTHQQQAPFRGPAQPGQPGPQPNQQWQTPAYQHDEDVPF
jgi:single-strand DNA-binding protein